VAPSTRSALSSPDFSLSSRRRLRASTSPSVLLRNNDEKSLLIFLVRVAQVESGENERTTDFGSGGWWRLYFEFLETEGEKEW